jgi:MFS family permease
LGVLQTFKASYNEMFQTLRTNKPFLTFQIAFMFYGVAFMVGSPATNLFYRDILDLNYSSVAFYRNIYNIIAIIVLPFMGRFLDRAGPMRFGIITFLSLMFYFLFVVFSGLFPSYFEIANIKIFHLMLVALIFHGLFASTMSLLWNIGSSYFGKNQEAGIFQNTHLFLTGVRAIPAPIIGIWIYEQWGFIPCFLLAILLLIIGIFVIRKSLKKEY